MGKFLDIIGGLASLNRGDVEGFNAGMTKEGRARLAQQRANIALQQQMAAEVMAKGQADPRFNPLLNQAEQPYLANRQTEAVTAGQGHQNKQMEEVARFFAQHGGSPQSAQFLQGQEGLRMQQQGLDQTRDFNDATLGFRAGDQEQTRVNAATQAEQWLRDFQANENYRSGSLGLQERGLVQQEAERVQRGLQFDQGHGLDVKRVGLQERGLENDITQRKDALAAQRNNTLAGLVNNFYPAADGSPSHQQNWLMQQMGLNMPPSPERVAAQQAAAAVMQRVQGGQGGTAGERTPPGFPMGSENIVPWYLKKIFGPGEQQPVQPGQPLPQQAPQNQLAQPPGGILDSSGTVGAGVRDAMGRELLRRLGMDTEQPGPDSGMALKRALQILQQLQQNWGQDRTNDTQVTQ